MKLYATTTSERATKGQGGNEKLEIVLTAENPDRREEFKITYQKDKDFTHLCVYSHEKGENILAVKTKGKQQTGECNHACITSHNNKETCDKCGYTANMIK